MKRAFYFPFMICDIICLKKRASLSTVSPSVASVSSCNDFRLLGPGRGLTGGGRPPPGWTPSQMIDFFKNRRCLPVLTGLSPLQWLQATNAAMPVGLMPVVDSGPHHQIGSIKLPFLFSKKHSLHHLEFIFRFIALQKTLTAII